MRLRHRTPYLLCLPLLAFLAAFTSCCRSAR